MNLVVIKPVRARYTNGNYRRNEATMTWGAFVGGATFATVLLVTLWVV